MRKIETQRFGQCSNGGLVKNIHSVILAAGLAAGLTAMGIAAPVWDGLQIDKVILRNGTTYVGTIVNNNDRVVEIETTVSNIKTTMKIEKWRIREIVDTDDAPDSTGGPSTDPAPSIRGGGFSRDAAPVPAAAEIEILKREGYALVLEIPLVGEFGGDIYPKAVDVSLRWAVDHGVSDVVFRIDSGGGQVWAADKIVEIMERYEDDLRYHGLIESAISASIWPMFECDTLTMAPGSDFGGAVVFSQTATGEVEVDKKMNSILAAKLSSAAEAKGHDASIVRAMMVSENEVWKYRRSGSSDSWKLTDIKANATAPGMEYEQVVTDQQILTLTSRKANELGVAKELADDSLESFASAVRLGPWDNAGSFGIESSDEWNKKSDDLRDRIDTTVRSLLIELSGIDDSMTIGYAGQIAQGATKKLAELKRMLRDAEDLEMGTIVKSYDELDFDLIEDRINSLKTMIRRARGGG